MADINHSKIPNLSIDSLDGSGASVPSLTVASTASLTVAGIAAFTGAESHSGAVTLSGAQTISGNIASSSTNTFSGANSFSGNLRSTSTSTIGGFVYLGTSGSGFSGLVRSTVSVAIAATAFDSVLTSAALSGITVGDPVLNIEKQSIWSGAYHDVEVAASCVSWGAVQFEARNSTNTTVNTAAMNFTITWLDLA